VFAGDSAGSDQFLWKVHSAYPSATTLQADFNFSST
jgi:hypothetical protein